MGGRWESHPTAVSLSEPTLDPETMGSHMHRVLTGWRLAPLFILLLSTPIAAEITRGPYLSGLTESSVVIRWLADDPSGSWTVAYSVVGSGRWHEVSAPPASPCPSPICCPPGVCSSSQWSMFRAPLTGLAPGASYEFEVRRDGLSMTSSLGPMGGPLSCAFQTPPSPLTEGASARFVVLGDSGAGTARQAEIAAFALEHDPVALVHTGDMFYGNPENGQLESYFFLPYRELLARVCLLPCMGNEDFVHDFLAEDHFDISAWGATGSDRYYACDLGPARVVVLDTEQLYAGYLQPASAGLPADPTQLDWMCAELADARASERAWLVVVCHVPPFTVGAHAGDDKVRQLRALLAPYFTEYQVDVVFSGHDHNYQRSWPVRFLETTDCATPSVPFDPACSAALPEDCYSFEVLADDSFNHLDATLYVVSGGGGQLGHPIPPPLGWDFAFGAVQHAGVQSGNYLVIDVTPVSLDLKAFDESNALVDHVRLGKLRGIRGDVNRDEALDVADAVATLSWLFGVTASDLCSPVADANGDGATDLADPVGVLSWLFVLGSSPPALPFPACGPIDATPDDACVLHTCGAP